MACCSTVCQKAGWRAHRASCHAAREARASCMAREAAAGTPEVTRQWETFLSAIQQPLSILTFKVD